MMYIQIVEYGHRMYIYFPSSSHFNGILIKFRAEANKKKFNKIGTFHGNMQTLQIDIGERFESNIPNVCLIKYWLRLPCQTASIEILYKFPFNETTDWFFSCHFFVCFFFCSWCFCCFTEAPSRNSISLLMSDKWDFICTYRKQTNRVWRIWVSSQLLFAKANT